jgi:hypothetical protein
MHAYAVYAGLSMTIVRADTITEARQTAIEKLGVEHKPYLAKDWEVHRATDGEVARYAAMADAVGASKPTARSAREGLPNTKARLL